VPKPLRSPAGGILSEIFGEVFDFVGDRVADAAPRCSLCGELAIPIRCACGGFACKSHGYFNFVLGRVICPICTIKLGASIGDDEQYEQYIPRADSPHPFAERVRARRQQRKQAQQAQQAQQAEIPTATAWELLGLNPKTATEADVNKVCRQLALECHPDLAPNDPGAAKRFKGLQKAKAACLADLKARG
jgi:hypothetical protein